MHELLKAEKISDPEGRPYLQEVLVPSHQKKQFISEQIENAEESISHKYNSVGTKEDPKPDWCFIRHECLSTAAGQLPPLAIERFDKLLIPDLPLPFEAILLPLVAYANRELNKKCNYDEWLTEPAQLDLERSLLAWLSGITSYALEHDFSILRSLQTSSLSRRFLSREKAPPTLFYKTFSQHLSGDALSLFFNEYPVAGEYVDRAIKNWVDVTAEMIHRYKEDKQRIQDNFYDGKETGKIIHVKTALSDRHNGGHTVTVLQFASGRQLVYKPKDTGIEKAWNDLLAFLNRIGAPVACKTFTVLNKTDYGWVQHVAANPVANADEAQRYYQRAGALLCLVYLLGATDLHYENIIGEGEYPFIIDLETLLHPIVHDFTNVCRSDNAQDRAQKMLIDSVVRTGLLPYWQLADSGSAFDVSGLGKFLPQDSCFQTIKWRNINTDQMQVRREALSVQSIETAIPLEKAEERHLHRYGREIIQGFGETYRFLVQKRDEILASSQWNAFAGLTVRFVFRPTQIYFQLQQNLLQPRLLTNFSNRSAYLERVLEDSAGPGSRPFWWPLLQQEKLALEKMDIPHFTARTDSDTITLPDGKTIKQYFAEPSFSAACKRLKCFNEQDLSRQTEFIKASLVCREADENHAFTTDECTAKSERFISVSKKQVLKQAVSIADRLLKQAVAGRDGSLTWIAPTYHPGANKYRLEPVALDLYNGVAGIALFFASLGKISGRKKYKDVALQCLQLPCAAIRESKESMNTVGGFTGTGSLVYCLLQVGLLLEHEPLIDASKSAARLVTNDAIKTDNQYDLLYGAAGTLLVLLKLYPHHPDEQLFDKIIVAGDHLLKNRTATTAGHRVWQTPKQPVLTGFSHGASGIAFALLQLFKLTGNKQYQEAALEAMAFEESVFDEKERNWPDFRQTANMKKENLIAENKFRCTWCHGATGIGLARIGALDVLDTDSIRIDIKNAVETTKRHLRPGADHLCCGNMGRIELLLAAALKFSDKALLHFTLGQAGAIVKRAEKFGDFRYHPQVEFTPGFFQGIAGIGYQLLRLMHPDILPSVLLLR